MTIEDMTTDPRVARRRDGQLTHVEGCARAFGRLDAEGCARCAELAAGAAPRPRPGGARRAVSEDAQRAAEIRSHFASAAHRDECGPVCTFGEW